MGYSQLISPRLLSGTTITSLASLHSSLRQLHVEHSVPHIVLSSIPLPISLVSTLNLPSPPSSYAHLLPASHPPWYDAVGRGSQDDEVLICFASTWTDEHMDTWGFALPTIRGYFSGVGDLFSAMVLAHFENSESRSDLPSLPHAVSKALLTVQQVLLRTHLYSLSHAGPSGAATPRPLHRHEETAKRDISLDSIIPSDVELDSVSSKGPGDPKRKAKRMRLRELRVVQERSLIADGGQGWPGQRMNWTEILQ